MRIAVIGYGSLIWDLDDLAPKVRGDWQLGAGPPLPVEFARVSTKRKQALALVIHNTVPQPSRTSFIMSRRQVLDEAIGDLALRERTLEHNIGVATSAGKATSRSGIAVQPVSAWLAQNAGGAGEIGHAM